MKLLNGTNLMLKVTFFSFSDEVERFYFCSQQVQVVLFYFAELFIGIRITIIFLS
jgi:hypothetical protein